MKYILLLSIASLVVFSCNSPQNNENNEAAEAVEVRIIDAYCTVDKLSVLDSPSRNGKLLTSLFLGEKVRFLDSLATDDSQSVAVEYGYVQLSDGKSGWVRTDHLAIDKIVGVAIEKLTIHSRPDMLNETDYTFQAMDFLVGHDEEGPWIKVSGRTGDPIAIREGWVFVDGLAYDYEIIKEALVFSKTIKEEDSDQKTETLNLLLENALERQSPFASYIEEKVNQQSYMPEKYERIFSTWFDFAEVHQDDEGPVLINGENYGRYGWGLFYLAEGMISSINKEFVADPSEEYLDARNEFTYTFEWNKPEITEALIAMSGIDPFIRDREQYTFTYINPEFVAWMSRNLIPDPDDNFLGTINRDIYNDFFDGQVELFAEGYLETHVNRDISVQVDEYHTSVILGEEDALEYLYLKYEDYDWVAGFWLRREIDESGPEFYKAMIKFLKLYNPQFYADHFEGLSYTHATFSGE